MECGWQKEVGKRDIIPMLSIAMAPWEATGDKTGSRKSDVDLCSGGYLLKRTKKYMDQHR